MLVCVFLLSAGLLQHVSTTHLLPEVSSEASVETIRDDGVSRKVLGSSVVTSVSVIMDKGSEKHYSDAVGKPQSKPPPGTQVASPINLLNPDRYEFYTFNDSGDLVKRLMTLSEIQGIIANADGEAFNQNSHSPEKKVNDVVHNVQNVLKEEMQKNKNNTNIVLDTPDVSSTWSVILPAIFGNSGEEIHPAKPQTSHTPETIMIEHQTAAIVKKPAAFTRTTQVPLITVPLSNTQRISATTPRSPIHLSTSASLSTTSDPISTTQNLSTIQRKPPFNLPTFFKRPPYKTTVKVTKRTTTTPSATTNLGSSTTLRPTTLPSAVDENQLETETNERVKHTTSSTTLSQASSQFIHLFDNLPSVTTNQKITDDNYTKIPTLSATTSPGRIPIGALFIIDEKTNTKIPIVTKEQLATILNTLEATTELFRNSSPDTKEDEPLLTFNSLTGHHNVQVPLATPSNIPSTSTKIDHDKYQQFLLTSTHIYDINKELAKSTTAQPILSSTRTIHPSPLISVSTPSTPQATDSLASTVKEPNLINSIEELIQQAVGNIQETQKETSTLADFTDTTEAMPSTTETPLSDDDLLNQAMDSLLSQVVSSDIQGLTTLQELPSTTEFQKKPVANTENLEFRLKTTDILSETTETGTESGTSATDSFKITTDYNSDSNTTSLGLLGQSTNNEILKSDATTYVASTESVQDIQHAQETDYSTANSDTTLQPTKDLPIIFELHRTDLPLLNDDAESNSPTNVTTEEVLLQEKPSSQLEDVPSNTRRPSTEKIPETHLENVNKLSTINPPGNIKITSIPAFPSTTEEEATITTIKVLGEDFVSVPSTNSYNEVHHQEISNEDLQTENSGPQSSTVTDQESSTLSIDALLKELTTKDENGQEIPKETTVLIITKPLYPVTPDISSVTTSTKSSAIETTSEPFEASSTQIPLDLQFETEPIASEGTETTILDSFTTEIYEKKREPQWTIVSTITPHNTTQIQNTSNSQNQSELKIPPPPKPVVLNPMPQLGGLEETTKNLDEDVYQFVGLCNELAFGFWKSVTTGISSARSVFLSPFAATSLLAMVFLGARGATSGEMNEILRLDDMVTFNPHLIFKNVSETVTNEKQPGVATSVIIRELYSDRSKGHLLNFYKERAKAFYDGHVEEVSFKEVGDVIRRRTNLIVKKQTGGKITEFVKDSSITVKSPLAGVSASIFQTDCSNASMEGRDGELYFVVLPSIRQRRLVPVPAAVWRSNFLAGYEPGIDATAVALGSKDQAVSTIFVIPGQQGIAAPGDGLARLERHLIGTAFKDQAWSRILQSLIPRPGLEVQIPRFQHRSVINATVALQQMGMKDLFDAERADLRGLNGVANDLFLSDILQINNFATCGEEIIGDSHHSEIYPATANRTYRRTRIQKGLQSLEETYYDSDISEEPRDYQRAFHDPLHDPSLYALPLPLRPRQARLPDPPRLRFDRPFLYFVRHNPTGLILHMGRFNPRLLP